MALVQLGEIANLQAGVGFPVNLQGRSSGDYPVAKVGDISRIGRSGESVINAATHYIDEGDLTRLKARPIPAGSVLFAKIGEAIRQNHRVIAGCALLVDNNAMAAIPTRRVESRFLYHFLRTVDFYRLASTTTVPALRKTVLERLPVPLPPLPEQQRIAEILDKADTLRAKRRAALTELDTLTQSIFLDMFGDPATNPKGWRESMLLGEAADIVSGVTIGRRLDGKSTRTVPYLAVVNVQDRRLALSVTRTTAATEEEIQRYRLERNDLLLTEGGDPDKLGRGTLWNGELPECIHQNHVFRVRLKSDEVTPSFLNWLIGSQRGKRYFLRSAKQTTGIASINMTQLRAFPLLLPPLRLQKEFANKVSSADTLKAQHVAALSELDALFASLQHGAFRGEV
jgi:type I restriction enzyme S subunit